MPDLSGHRFTKTHEWVRLDDGDAVVGISDFAQAQLGDVIFLELPEVGVVLRAGEKFGVIESVKAASDLYLPVGGRVAAVNTALDDAPQQVNQDPMGEGWMLRLDDVSEDGAILLDPAAYQEMTEAGH